MVLHTGLVFPDLDSAVVLCISVPEGCGLVLMVEVALDRAVRLVVTV